MVFFPFFSNASNYFHPHNLFMQRGEPSFFSSASGNLRQRQTPAVSLASFSFLW
jgi:hypothetical protein